MFSLFFFFSFFKKCVGGVGDPGQMKKDLETGVWFSNPPVRAPPIHATLQRFPAHSNPTQQSHIFTPGYCLDDLTWHSGPQVHLYQKLEGPG